MASIKLSRDEISTIIASTWNQYRAEDPNTEYGKRTQEQIKSIHKRLSKFVNMYAPDFELEVELV